MNVVFVADKRPGRVVKEGKLLGSGLPNSAEWNALVKLGFKPVELTVAEYDIAVKWLSKVA